MSEKRGYGVFDPITMSFKPQNPEPEKWEHIIQVQLPDGAPYTKSEKWVFVPVIYGRRLLNLSRFEQDSTQEDEVKRAGGQVVGKTIAALTLVYGAPVRSRIFIYNKQVENLICGGKVGVRVGWGGPDRNGLSIERWPAYILLTPGQGDDGCSIE